MAGIYGRLRITRRRQRGFLIFAVALLLLAFKASVRADDPTLGVPVMLTNSSAVCLNLTNCSDTNFLYVIQASTNLVAWTSYSTNLPTGDGSPTFAPAVNATRYYRIQKIPRVPIPMFRGTITTSSNVSISGTGTILDSFDSGDPQFSTNGQYTNTLRKAGGDLLTTSPIFHGVNIGSPVQIYGSVRTGPGSPPIHAGGSTVGELLWVSNSSGIEPGHYFGDFYLNFPDAAPPTVSWLTLPLTTNNVITLNGGDYFTSGNLNRSLNITGPTRLWVLNSFSGDISIAATNNASLALYVGTGDTNNGRYISPVGSGLVNFQGNARNLQIYGLPSVTTVDFSGIISFTGTIYAPQAALTAMNGNNSTDYIGAFVVKSATLGAHCNFHFDESLLTNGPAF